MNKKNSKKKGVSLVVLLITIIVMLILAGAIIISVTDTNLISNSNNIKFKNNVQVMIDNYKAVYDDVLYKYFGDESLLKNEDFQNADIILKDYTNRFSVDKDGIIYTGTDENEIQLLSGMDVRINN